jgi:K+-sensing histidine kinase KdpD
LTLEDYSVPEVVKSVVIATEPLATSKGLKFTAALQDDLPMAHGDARRVSQVLLNLVGNAIKFTDKGEIEIRAIIDKGQFVLTVRDTGRALPTPIRNGSSASFSRSTIPIRARKAERASVWRSRNEWSRCRAGRFQSTRYWAKARRSASFCRFMSMK